MALVISGFATASAVGLPLGTLLGRAVGWRGSFTAVVVVAVVGTGLFGMGTAPSLQHRVTALAGPGAPRAPSLPASAVNAGIAGGSFVGGLTIAAGGVAAVALVGGAVAAVAVAVAAATSALRPAPSPGTTADEDVPARA